MHIREVLMVTVDIFGVEVGLYRRANGKRPWQRVPLRVPLDMIREGDLWRKGDGLLVGLTAEAVARATALEAAWEAEVAPERDGDRANPAHATYYERKDSYSQLKGGLGGQTLSGPTFSGVYRGCRDSGWESHSGIICYDLDHLSRAGLQAAAVRDRCKALTYVICAFISPSGDGVKVGIVVTPVPQTRRQHLAAWEQGRERLMRDLGIPIDLSDIQAKNPSRLCFLGHDPGIYIASPEAMEALSVDLTEGTTKTETKAEAPAAGGGDAGTGGAEAAGGTREPASDGGGGLPHYMRSPPSEWLKAYPQLYKKGTQLQGPCPECGGDDRFHVNTEYPYLWKCRKCAAADRASWPWFAVFRPWYRPGDSTGPGKLGPWECTADADCLRLIRRHAAELLLVEADGGGSCTLMADNGFGVWRPSEARLKALLLMTNREWYGAARDANLEDKARGRVTKWALSNANNKSRTDALASVGAVAGWMAESGTWPRGLTRCRESDLNRPGALYIGAPNGVVGLAEQHLLTRDEGRSKLISRMITDDYAPDARDPDVDLLFSHLDPLDREYLLDSFGFGMRGRPSRRFFFLDGIGNDGKSTLANAMVQTLGDYAGVAMAPSMFTSRNERPDAPAAYLIPFQETPLMFIPEPPKHDFNWRLLRQIAGGDTTGARQPHTPVQGSRKKPFLSTCFFYTNPDERPVPPPLITLAIYDRYRLIEYPHIPEGKRDEDLPNRLWLKPARQALATLIIRHSMRHLEGPPPDSPKVALNRRRTRRESIGEAGEWLLSRVIPTGDASDRMTTDELWEAAIAACGGGEGDGIAAWGYRRRQFADYAKLLLGLGTPTRGRVAGKICYFWRRYKLLSEEEAGQAVEERMAARREAAAQTPSGYSLTYCRVCRIMLLQVLEALHLEQHTAEEPAEAYACFRCGTQMPAGQPFQVLCTECEGKTSDIHDNQAAVMEGIAGEIEQSAEAMAAHIQTQVDFMEQLRMAAMEEELEQEEDLWWPEREGDNREGENGSQ